MLPGRPMLDIKLIRERPDEVKRSLGTVGTPPALVDAVLEADAHRRKLITEAEQMRATRASTSKTVGKLAPPERERVVAEMRALGDRISEVEQQVAAAEEAFTAAMMELPNLPHPDVPVGPDETANRLVREVGVEPAFAFTPRPHWDLGPALGIIDFERGVKISGSRFYVLLGAGARLQRALISWMVDLHVTEHGYREVYPPAMVRTECAIGTGQLPKFGDTMYRDIEEDFWFVPTAEVPVTNLYREEVLEPGRLPIRHVAYTPCFRREKMSAGRDVRGIKRGHQFDKVEMVKFVAPETSDAELVSLLDDAEDVCRRLGPAPSRRGDVHRRSQFHGGDEVRCRDLGPRLRRMARGLLLLQLPRFPGAPRQHPLPAGAGREARARAHAERLGPGPAARDDRGARDLPAGGRQRPGAVGAAAVHGRDGADRSRKRMKDEG